MDELAHYNDYEWRLLHTCSPHFLTAPLSEQGPKLCGGGDRLGMTVDAANALRNDQKHDTRFGGKNGARKSSNKPGNQEMRGGSGIGRSVVGRSKMADDKSGSREGAGGHKREHLQGRRTSAKGSSQHVHKVIESQRKRVQTSLGLGHQIRGDESRAAVLLRTPQP